MPAIPPVRLFTCCTRQRLESGLLDRLLTSVADQHCDDVVHYICLMDLDPMVDPRARIPHSWVRLDQARSLLPLSVGRNRLLRRAQLDQAISDEAIVGFPDDDAWYPPDVLRRIAAIMVERSVELVVATSNDPPDSMSRLRFSGEAGPCGYAHAIDNATSSCIFLRGNCAKATGLFDEHLGIGTPLASAEDPDYAIRALQTGAKGWFAPDIVVGHKVSDKVIAYYPGNLVLPFRHLFVSPVFRDRALRALGWTLQAAWQRQIPLSDWLWTLGQCLRAPFWRRPALL